jgi:hypothetical protein
MWKENNIIERVLWLENQKDIAFVIDIYSNYYSPILREISDILYSISSGYAEVLNDDPYCRIVNEQDISDSSKEKRDKAWEIVSFILKSCDEPYIYNSELRSEYIKEASDKYGISEKTIREYFKKYWQRGKTKNSLLPDFYKTGCKGKEKNDSENKRGRPRKFCLKGGVNVDNKMKDTFRNALNKFYYTTKENSLKTAYILMLKEYFFDSYRYDEGVKKPILIDKNKIPTFGQFRYWYIKERNIKKEVSMRRSAKRYFLENREVLGNSTLEAMGSGAIYLIDATVMNIYIISTFSNDIVGRPILYNVIDVYSRMIVGFYIGFEQNSWVGAMVALSNSAMDKVEFCSKYGVTITESEWPVSNCLPKAILADRGEMIGKNVENLISGLGIRISNTPSYRAELKPIVEKYFDIIHTSIKPYIPGYVGGDYLMRGGKDYRLEAALTIQQLTQILIKCVLFLNNHHWMDNYKREEMMIEDDINPIPSEIWHWGIENKSGKLQSIKHDVVKLSLMPKDKATVTGRGIRYKGIYYGSNTALKEKWFEKARNSGSFKIDVSYDPQNMDYIYMLTYDSNNYEKCFLLNHEERYKGKTLEEIELLLQYEKKKSVEYEEENELQAKVDLISDIEAIVKDAKEQAKKFENVKESNAKKVKNIRENRARERLISRERDYLELDEDEILNKAIYRDNFNINGEDYLSDDMKLIERMQKDRLSNDKTN